MEHKCEKCGNDLRKIIRIGQDKKVEIVCRDCKEVISSHFRCVECGKEIAEEDSKGYIKLYQDDQLEYYSILCEECKDKKRN